MSLKLAARLVTVEPYKIADLQENDTAYHILDLKDIVPPETKALLIRVYRTLGTGDFHVYPFSGATYTIKLAKQLMHNICIVTIKNQELKWFNTVANDAWEIRMFGYFVQTRTD